MEFKDLIGKTIIDVTVKKLAKYDDEGFLELKFSDGTGAVIISSYSEYTGSSLDEYPTSIGITDNYDDELVERISEPCNTPLVMDCSNCKYLEVSKYVNPCYGCRDNGGYDHYVSAIVS